MSWPVWRPFPGRCRSALGSPTGSLAGQPAWIRTRGRSCCSRQPMSAATGRYCGAPRTRGHRHRGGRGCRRIGWPDRAFGGVCAVPPSAHPVGGLSRCHRPGPQARAPAAEHCDELWPVGPAGLAPGSCCSRSRMSAWPLRLSTLPGAPMTAGASRAAAALLRRSIELSVDDGSSGGPRADAGSVPAQNRASRRRAGSGRGRAFPAARPQRAGRGERLRGDILFAKGRVAESATVLAALAHRLGPAQPEAREAMVAAMRASLWAGAGPDSGAGGRRAGVSAPGPVARPA